MSDTHDLPDVKPDWFKRTIMRPSVEFERAAVSHVQRVLGVPIVNGEMDEPTIGHIRGFQSLFGLSVTGYLDEATAIQVDRVRNRYAV